MAHNLFSLKQQPASTDTDRLTSYLVLQCGKFPDILANLIYMKYLPRRLNESQALYDCLNFFCDCWANYRSGCPPDRLIDLRLHARALRSLQHAIDGPQQLRLETFAAVILLHRVEILFDTVRGSHVTVHSGGIIALMTKRGPPKLDDPLDAYLLLDIQGPLVSLDSCVWASAFRGHFA